MEIFKDDLITWTENDIQINKLKSEIAGLNINKKEKEIKILNYIKENNLETQTFELPNFNYILAYKNQKSSEGYTVKYLNDKLSKYFEEKDIHINIDECLDYLRENRVVNYKPILKKN